MLDTERCWQAVVTRDRALDGSFFYGVRTTGVFCRPSCASRRPNRGNVTFYAAPAAALADGLRPCLRCQPLARASDRPVVAAMRRLCQYIEAHATEPITLADLSRRAKLSASHLQRTFTAVVGVSPKQYLDGCRMRALKSSLRDPAQRVSTGITGAIFDAGFGSVSRVYERARTHLGMTPMDYRAGGKGIEISYATTETPLGRVMVGATDRGVCFVQFGDRTAGLLAALRAKYPLAIVSRAADPRPPQLAAWMASLTRYLAVESMDIALPVHVRATAFQLKVWSYLRSIPVGAVETYQSVAKVLGQPTGARAVARACASNEVALVIPCHRVIRGSGELAGYRWGLERKQALLEQERRMAERGSSRKPRRVSIAS